MYSTVEEFNGESPNLIPLNRKDKNVTNNVNRNYNEYRLKYEHQDCATWCSIFDNRMFSRLFIVHDPETSRQISLVLTLFGHFTSLSFHINSSSPLLSTHFSVGFILISV
jgi:hypothetical protein